MASPDFQNQTQTNIDMRKDVPGIQNSNNKMN